MCQPKAPPAAEPRASDPPNRSVATAPTAITAPSDAATDSSTATPSASASAVPDAGVPPTKPIELGTDPTRFACGHLACRAGKESCCLGESADCVPTVAPTEDDEITPLASQLQACPHGQPSTLTRCDESIDCPRQQLCCSGPLDTSSNGVVCQSPGPGGRFNCTDAEHCVKGGSCRSQGAVCVPREGVGYVCEKPVASLPCAGKRCGKGEVCCGDPQTCVALEACQGFAVRCSQPKDCLPGQRCVVNHLGSYCTGYGDVGTASVACATDADCGYADRPCARMRCRADADLGFKTCACP
ncbi:MAG: hypothetical protein R3B13_03585 [Polyangiaceae bacterium]